MKFSVYRTSGSRYYQENDPAPCDGAVLEKIIRVDERTVDDSSKLHYSTDRERWYNIGSNHRVENGNIKRDFEKLGWTIEIESLEKLLSLDIGIFVVSARMAPELNQLEIYDDYRE